VTKPSVFQLIDLDRTLFDTSKFARALTDEINLTEPGLGTELDDRFEEAYKKEQTFFLMRHLRHQKGDEWFENLVSRVVGKYGGEAFLLPGARERLAFAETVSSLSPAWGILTYGDKVDQLLKMRIVGLGDALVYITNTPNKGEVLHTWKTDKGTFQLPSSYGGEVVDALILEDDKLRAFHNLPEGVTGLWLATSGKEGHGEIGNEVGEIIPVATLFESIEYLRKRFF